MEEKTFQAHYNGNNVLFIKDGDIVYTIDLVEGNVQRFSGKLKKGRTVEIDGLWEGICRTKTAYAKKLEEEKLRGEINQNWKKIRTFLREKSIVGQKMVSLEELIDALKIDKNLCDSAIDYLRKEGIIFMPKPGYVSLI